MIRLRSLVLPALPVMVLTVLAMVARAGAGGLYFSNRGQNKIQRASYDGSAVTDLILSAGGNVRGVALDLSGGKIYWADNGADVLHRAGLDGSGRQQIVTNGTGFPADIRLDVQAGVLYWCDRDQNRIRRAPLAGGTPVNLISGITQPYYLDREPGTGKFYWGDFAAGNVYRANADGSGQETVVTGNLETRAVCLDPAGGRLYWVNRNAGRIQRAALSALPVNAASSPAVQTLYSGLDTPHGMVLDVPAGKVYWVDTGTNGTAGSVGSRSVLRGDMDGSGALELLIPLGSEPWDIDLDPRVSSWQEWVGRFFRKSAPAADMAFLADPDGDGVPNVTECALAMHPLRPDAHLLPQALVVEAAGEQYPAVRYRRRTTLADVAAVVQPSPDLEQWTDPRYIDAVLFVDVSTVPDPAEPGVETVTTRSVIPLSSGQRHFFRVLTGKTP